MKENNSCAHQYDSNGVHASPYQIWHETSLLNELSLAIEQTISSTINYCSLSLCLTMKAWTNAILLNKCNDMTFVTTLQNFNSIWAALKIISLLICNHFSRKVVLEKVVLQTRIFFLIGDPEKIQVYRTTFLQPEKMSPTRKKNQSL